MLLCALLGLSSYTSQPVLRKSFLDLLLINMKLQSSTRLFAAFGKYQSLNKGGGMVNSFVAVPLHGHLRCALYRKSVFSFLKSFIVFKSSQF